MTMAENRGATRLGEVRAWVAAPMAAGEAAVPTAVAGTIDGY